LTDNVPTAHRYISFKIRTIRRKLITIAMKNMLVVGSIVDQWKDGKLITCRQVLVGDMFYSTWRIWSWARGKLGRRARSRIARGGIIIRWDSMVPRCSVVVKFVVAFLGMWLGMLGMEERGDVRWNGCLEDNEIR
jgi:hypothetical protein